MSRLQAIHGDSFDVAIVGGGIIGCGVARDAALRGLKVVLVEQRDFGSGTTAASTRIVHGGLRYLRQLDVGLVRLDLRERETLLRIAPHLVKPLEFLIPFEPLNAFERAKLRIGLALYDALSIGGSLPAHRLTRDGAVYYDARVDSPERLSLENLIDAAAHGARVFNYCAAVAALQSAGSITGLRVRDTRDGSEAEVRARVIVNATGPWFERTAAALSGRRPGRVRTTKGIHLVCPAMTERALVLFSSVDHRLLFAIPRLGQTWIGTTDTDYSGNPSDAVATRADAQYLIDSVGHTFPSLSLDDVLYTTAGVRALVNRRGPESSVSRMHKVVDGEPVAPAGVVSVLGGKITGYRAIAEEVTDVVCRHLSGHRRSITAETPIPEAAGAAWAPDARLTAEQVTHAVRSEYCVTVADFVRRRTLLGATADQGWSAVPAVASVMARELGWSSERMAAEIEAYRLDIARTLAFRL